MAGRRFRILAATIAIGFVLAIGLGVAGVFGGGKAVGASTTLTVIGGDVMVRHGAGEFTSAVDGDLLKPGDAIKTGSDGRAVLTYFEGSSVTIEPATELVIESASTSAEGGTVVVMQQAIGRTWHVVTKLITSGSKYEVRTPASTASVRGTAFTVDVDQTSTTVTTTEGSVVDSVPSTLIAGRTIDVPVRAGQQHKQMKDQPASETNPAPAPERKVTITLTDQNTLVIDTLGRANGFDKNGKKVLQTPGATLEVVDGRLVITLPNIPDGLLQALTRTPGDVDVTTLVEERGRSTTSNGKIAGDSSGGRANVTIGGGDTNNPTKTSEPSSTETPKPAPSQAGGGGGAPSGPGGGQGGGPTAQPSRPSGGPGGGSGGPGGGTAVPGGSGGQGLPPTPRASSGVLPQLPLPTLPGSSPPTSRELPPGGGTAAPTSGAQQSPGGAQQPTIPAQPDPTPQTEQTQAPQPTPQAQQTEAPQSPTTTTKGDAQQRGGFRGAP